MNRPTSWLSRSAAVLFIAGSATGPAAAEPLAQAELDDEDRASAATYLPKIDKQLGFTNPTCGTSLTYDVAWSTFVGHTGASNTNTMGLYAMACADVLGSIYGICGKDGLGKETVRASITEVRCHYDEGAALEKLGRRGPTLRLEGNVLHAGFQAQTTNVSQGTTPWLEDNLQPVADDGKPAVGISLADRRDIARATTDQLEKPLGWANQDCGTTLTFAMDWQSFAGKNRKNKNMVTAAAYCGNVIKAVRAACADESNKKAIASKIQSVACTWDEQATRANLGVHRPTLRIEDGVLHAGYHWANDETQTQNAYNGTLEWLPDQL